MSEIEMIYKALTEYEAKNAVIYKDGSMWALQVDFIYYNGDTIGDAIRNFYELIEKDEAKE